MKKYWIDVENYIGKPGEDIYQSMAEFFADYKTSEKTNKVTIQLNDITVTLERKRF